MDKNLSVLQLGALLHDIGKLVRRAGRGSGDHTLEGVIFLKEHLLFEPTIKEQILDIVNNHHYRQLSYSNLDPGSLAYIVYEADNIASSIDRRDYEDLGKGDEKSYLNSVFNILKPHESINEKKFKIDRLNEKSINMPLNLVTDATSGEYAGLLELFKTNLQAITQLDESNKLLMLMESVFSSFPSSAYVDRPDTSMYDHLKLTSAIATCMYSYDRHINIIDFKNEYFTHKESRNKKKFMLVSGEMSGIQDFIYTISSKMAMKALRGRSFYLELLVETLIDELLEDFNLSRANLIFSGGSRFYLLLPNTDKVKERLSNYQDVVNDFLLHREGINLYFAMSYVEASADQLANGISNKIKNSNQVSELYKNLSISISRKKLKRYSQGQLSDLFNPDSVYNNIASYDKECTVCKKPAPLQELERHEHLHYGVAMCDSCAAYIDLGKSISKIHNDANSDHFFVLTKDKTGIEVPLINGDTANITFVKKSDLLISLRETTHIKRVYSINSNYIGNHMQTNLWVGNYNCKANDQELIEFSELSKRSKGIHRLAVLRADVDNLSTVFRSGFENPSAIENKYKYVTFSKSVTLSRYLSDFFKRKVNVIMSKSDRHLSENELFREYSNFISEDDQFTQRAIVLVYSGGDDLFAIGAWHDIIEFSVDLRTAFKEFTNQKLTLSAGIGIYSDGYPVHQMAKQTGELETLAKRNMGDSKDSIALFGVATNNYGMQESHVYHWDDFIDTVINQKYKLLKKLIAFDEDERRCYPHKIHLGKSVLYRLIDLIRSVQIKEDKRLDVARFAYTLARITHTHEQAETYQQLKYNLFNWIKVEMEARQLLTCLILLVYGHRESED